MCRSIVPIDGCAHRTPYIIFRVRCFCTTAVRLGQVGKEGGSAEQDTQDKHWWVPKARQGHATSGGCKWQEPNNTRNAQCARECQSTRDKPTTTRRHAPRAMCHRPAIRKYRPPPKRIAPEERARASLGCRGPAPAASVLARHHQQAKHADEDVLRAHVQPRPRREHMQVAHGNIRATQRNASQPSAPSRTGSRS
jgi:hypothetical protein